MFKLHSSSVNIYHIYKMKYFFVLLYQASVCFSPMIYLDVYVLLNVYIRPLRHQQSEFQAEIIVFD